MSTLSRLSLCMFILGIVAIHHASQGGADAIVPLIITMGTAFLFVAMGTVDNVRDR